MRDRQFVQGLNGIEINLVNANNVYLTPAYIAQEAAPADALRPYGIKISPAINFGYDHGDGANGIAAAVKSWSRSPPPATTSSGWRARCMSS